MTKTKKATAPAPAKQPVVSLDEMIRKRHSGDGWIVLDEVGNGTGYNVSRHADAFAMSIWPSRGYEIHGYEIKRSRGDVKKELDDPAKADAVGKFCDYWWLVVSDLSIIDGLVIPATWGILHPRNQVLRVHVKAPKRDATPVSRAFAAAVTRRVCASFVPKWQHDELKKNADEKARADLERDRRYQKDEATYELEQLRARIKVFEESSGVDISKHPPWQGGKIGAAVMAVLRAQSITEMHGHGIDDPVRAVDDHAASLERKIDGTRRVLSHMEDARNDLRALRRELEPARLGVDPSEHGVTVAATDPSMLPLVG